MRRAALLIAWLLAVFGAGVAEARPAPRQPVVVELFTSQGCSSCAKADQLINGLADRRGVLALTLAVDYWDYLGWTDTFAKPEFTARQRAYMRRLSMREVYTPQIVVDGREQAAGADPAKIDALIDHAARTQWRAPSMSFQRHEKVRIGPGHAPRGGADIWLVRYDPRAQEVTVKRGENRGQTITERNVVRQLVKLGVWNGRAARFSLDPPPEGPELKTCVLLQAKGGRILGVLQR